MTDLPVRRVDLIADSLDSLIAVSFAATRSPSYHLAVNIARSCDRYQELELGKQLVHFAVFERTLNDAGRALAVVGISMVRRPFRCSPAAGSLSTPRTWFVSSSAS